VKSPVDQAVSVYDNNGVSRHICVHLPVMFAGAAQATLDAVFLVFHQAKSKYLLARRQNHIPVGYEGLYTGRAKFIYLEIGGAKFA
jgi:hypothetical protein